MFRTSKKILLVGAVVAVVLGIGASQADAWWAYRPVYSGCYTPCYSPCYSACCNPCYSSCGGWYVGVRPGPVRRVLLGPYRWYYSGCWTDCCYDACSYDACCGVVTTVSSTATTSGVPTKAEKPATEAPTIAPEPTEAEPSLPPTETDIPDALPGLEPDTGGLPGLTPDSGLPFEPAIPSTPGLTPDPGSTLEPATPPMPGLTPGFDSGTSAVPTRDNSGLLVVWVPYDAKVMVNGLATQSKGSRRQFVSHGLKPGFSYKYVVRAEVVRNGQLVEDVRTVILNAGDRQAVAFGFNPAPVEGLATN